MKQKNLEKYPLQILIDDTDIFFDIVNSKIAELPYR